MKNKIKIKGFTLFELLVVTTMITAVAAGIYFFVLTTTADYTTEEILYPQRATARSQRELVEEMRRANDLKEREINEHSK